MQTPSEDLLFKIMPKNAGAHNSVYRGKDITNLFYNGTLSPQIANQTFDDIFVGDYIIGNVSNKKYLVADINYRFHCSNTQITTPHILMIPEGSMGLAKMNDTDITTGAYADSKMRTEYLTPYKTIIQNDFGTNHILSHNNFFARSVTNGYENSGTWYQSEIDLMNERMVYGSDIYHNKLNGTNLAMNTTVDRCQLSLFAIRKDLILLNPRSNYWLRDVVSNTTFATVDGYGFSFYGPASSSFNVRPAFLIY